MICPGCKVDRNPVRMYPKRGSKAKHLFLAKESAICSECLFERQTASTQERTLRHRQAHIIIAPPYK